VTQYNSASSRVDRTVASRMWKMGKSASAIAAFFEVSKNIIIGISNRERDLFPAKNPKRNEIPDWRKRVNLEKASAMWAAEKKTSEIARHFEVYPHHIMHLTEERRDLFPKRKRGGNTSSTPRQRVERVRIEKDAFIQKLFEAPSLTNYDAERLPFAKTLIDLERNECKFALTNHTPHLFCSAPSKGNYCENHQARSYRPA